MRLRQVGGSFRIRRRTEEIMNEGTKPDQAQACMSFCCANVQAHFRSGPLRGPIEFIALQQGRKAGLEMEHDNEDVFEDFVALYGVKLTKRDSRAAEAV